jgi:hypothetical protein
MPEKLARFSVAIRESTLKRLRMVPEGAENWRVDPQAMSFADNARHLIEADRWLLESLRLGIASPMVGVADVMRIVDRSEYLALLDELIAPVVSGRRV